MKYLPAMLSLGMLLFAAVAGAAEPETGEMRQIEEGRDFKRVVPAQPTRAAPGEVEVSEFFWY